MNLYALATLVLAGTAAAASPSASAKATATPATKPATAATPKICLYNSTKCRPRIPTGENCFDVVLNKCTLTSTTPLLPKGFSYKATKKGANYTAELFLGESCLVPVVSKTAKARQCTKLGLPAGMTLGSGANTFQGDTVHFEVLPAAKKPAASKPSS